MGGLRNPAYTGSNRCVPCTVLNITIATLGAILVFFTLHAANVSFALELTSILLLIAFLLIWLRGYLLPYTPTLTKRYVPDWLLTRFGKTPADPFADTVDLTETTILAPCEDADSYRLAPAIEQEITEAESIIDITADADRFLTQLATDPVLERELDRWTATTKGTHIRTWDSDSTLRLEIAITEVLAWHLQIWNELAGVERTQLLATVRYLYEQTQTASPCSSLHEISKHQAGVDAPGLSRERAI